MQKRHNKFLFWEALLIVIGIILLSYNFVGSKRTVAYEYMNNKLNTFESTTESITVEQAEVVTEEINSTTNENITVTDNNVPNYYYIGYLEIPKIGLKKGFVDKNSTDNDVEKNILIISSSSYPDVTNGNLIMAAHSGTGYKAFFKDLHNLSLTDQAIVTYNNVRYTYEIVDIYTQPKNGQVSIRRDKGKNTLTLITCTEGSNDTQTIYIAYLIDEAAV